MPQCKVSPIIRLSESKDQEKCPFHIFHRCLLVLLFVLRGLFSIISNVSIQWIATRIVMDIRTNMFDRIVSLPNHYYDINATGNIISKLTYNVNQVTSACTSSLVILIKDSFTILGLLAWMFYLDWKMSLIFFLVLPIAGILVKIVSNRLRRLSRSLQETVGDLAEILANTPEATRDAARPWLLAPVDLQAVKAAGVTFPRSMLERVIEEQAKGAPEKADAIRQQIADNNHNGGNEIDGQNNRVVPCVYRVDEKRSHTGPRKDLLDDDRAA